MSSVGRHPHGMWALGPGSCCKSDYVCISDAHSLYMYDYRNLDILLLRFNVEFVSYVSLDFGLSFRRDDQCTDAQL
jgi:hypothetical protein